jgi:hypothetical protein
MSQSLEELRLDLAVRSKWNLGFFWAGLVFWVYAAVIGWLYPLQTARLFWLIGTSFIFPVAILVSRLIGVDPFSKQNPLGAAVGYTHMSVILMTLPLVVIAYLRYPEFMILVLATSTSLSFYVMGWAFGSPLFVLHAALRSAAVTVIWFAYPTARSWLIPVVVAGAYGMTVMLSPVLRARWLRAHSRRVVA